jgi:hypothetical protein
MRWSSPDLSNEAQYICGRDGVLHRAQESRPRENCAAVAAAPMQVLFIEVLWWSTWGPDGFVLCFRIDEDRTHWRIAVPNWELLDLRGRESTRLFFTFILQVLGACQESKEGAYAGAFGVASQMRGKLLAQSGREIVLSAAGRNGAPR